MKRTSFRKLTGASLSVRLANSDDDIVLEGNAKEGDVLLYETLGSALGKIVAVISPDDFYDQDGNRFSY